MKELKPCPFCGGFADLRHGVAPDGNHIYGVTWIQCFKCGCRTPNLISDGYYGIFATDDDVIDIWNRRASDVD